MEKSFAMDLDDWELLPDTDHHALIDFNLEAEKGLLISKNIDINYFSNDKNVSNPSIEDKEECKDVYMVPPPQPPVSMIMTDHHPDADDEFVESEKEDDDEEEKKKSDKEMELDIEEKEKQLGLKIWRWRVMGSVGALCSFGVAAATLCILMLGGRQQQHQHHQSNKIQFQIYTDEKRIKQVVQQASRLNHALSAVRGVPVSRAHISFGGYYDGL